ncbi:hypothetical protein GCM10010371_20870 [Streptomyces subrutilus]|uniref:TIGR04222 domain-containing membrane protein n=1 Tax=Streptomyces subrutilus TaxID=36818 RepID=A0A918V3Y6_9ACTN|nr:TIGR04222 domain-containing membrane protein [Streptomyces subrutilus]GGZ61145.1 hypothetical protein GCM10010371_20870 [Streptomyces subrutilus]
MNLLALAVWVGVLTSCVLLGAGVRRSRRPVGAGAGGGVHDLSEAAFLSGGPGGMVDTALVALLGDGRLAVGGPGIVHVRPGARAAGPAERAVLQAYGAAPSGWLYQVRYAAMLDPAVQRTGDALAARGLLAPPGAGRTWRRWGLAQIVVCVLLVLLSLPVSFFAYLVRPGPQVPFAVEVLPVLVLGIVAGRVCATRARNRLTPAGARELRRVRAAYPGEQGPYVQTALFGPRGLRDPYLREQLTAAARSTRLAAAQARARGTRGGRASSASDSVHGAAAVGLVPVFWCAGSDGGGGGSGCGSGSCASGSNCGSSGGGCGGSGGSSCSGGSGCGGSGCGSSG